MQTWSQVLGKHPRRLKNFWLLVIGLCAGSAITKILHDQWTAWDAPDTVQHTAPYSDRQDLALVVASQSGDNTTWLDSFQNWSKHIYVTDDPTANLTVPANRGREGMAYLTYIIDNYEQLPRTIVFSHSNRYQWHNDDPFYDGQAVLRRLNISHVIGQGYVNLRCAWTLGCPAEIHPVSDATAPPPASDPGSNDARAGSFYKQAFQELFPDVDVPDVIGSACCAQFAATAEAIRARPKTDYQRFREWLLTTSLRDDLSGRILEYSWHMIFGKEPVFCPDARSCYCKLFNLCGLQCEERGLCRAAYTLPTYSTLPAGWPDVDWDDNRRNATAMMIEYESKYMNGAE
ncbi:hypothetical protein M409DRAFT_66134 [Zasmidium cellare ATCC 36951]|uniref:Uncharacterized protein n=1 Tax=Zasmidium cellare ATCC 36951 TaxID=1080233 RepID=A0A6A6CM90_ZASCE|nr:uncharacterized protein M409DRAFT_66134 [Zasmidium cellare ATCC 36951]KAF2167042.1 hypothetical protein M409DRAFT_66134 [Zasmidium cellare ATCC 36951]